MSDPVKQTGGTNPPAQRAMLRVPDEVAQKFGSYVTLIRGSESMNDEERQYWVNILPIMTPEQLQNLKEILENERKQLQAIDEKYAKEMEKLQSADALKLSEEDRRLKRQTRSNAEESHKRTEEEQAESILKQIESTSS